MERTEFEEGKCPDGYSWVSSHRKGGSMTDHYVRGHCRKIRRPHDFKRFLKGVVEGSGDQPEPRMYAGEGMDE